MDTQASERLRAADVMVIGAGPLGAPAAGYLAAAGVGRLGIVDGETVSDADLRGALLHFAPDLGANRAESLAAKLGLLNPRILVEPYPAEVDAANAAALVAGRDAVVDCSGDAATAALLREACSAAEVPLIGADAPADGEPFAGPEAGITGAGAALAALRLLSSRVRQGVA